MDQMDYLLSFHSRWHVVYVNDNNIQYVDQLAIYLDQNVLESPPMVILYGIPELLQV